MSDGIQLPPLSGQTQVPLTYPTDVAVETEQRNIPVSWETRYGAFIGTDVGIEGSVEFSTPLNESWSLTAGPYARLQAGENNFGLEPGIKIGATNGELSYAMPLGYEFGGGGFNVGLEIGYHGFEHGFDPVVRVTTDDDGGSFTFGFSRRF